jgi:hypothetical protein
VVADKARQLDRRLVGLGPGVAEERALHSRDLRQLARQLLL